MAKSADTNFSNAIDTWREVNNTVIFNGNTYFYERRGAKGADKNRKIGFTEAVFDPRANADVTDRTNFWINPDFVAVRPKINKEQNGNEYHCIFIEHCGSWQNFYQKRFFYLGNNRGVGLSFFQKTKEGWDSIGNIFIDKILYMLPNAEHSERVIRVTPEFDHKIFSLNYGDWRAEAVAFEPSVLFENGNPRQHYVDLFNNRV